MDAQQAAMDILRRYDNDLPEADALAAKTALVEAVNRTSVGPALGWVPECMRMWRDNPPPGSPVIRMHVGWTPWMDGDSVHLVDIDTHQARVGRIQRWVRCEPPAHVRNDMGTLPLVIGSRTFDGTYPFGINSDAPEPSDFRIEPKESCTYPEHRVSELLPGYAFGENTPYGWDVDDEWLLVRRVSPERAVLLVTGEAYARQLAMYCMDTRHRVLTTWAFDFYWVRGVYFTDGARLTVVHNRDVDDCRLEQLYVDDTVAPSPASALDVAGGYTESVIDVADTIDLLIRAVDAVVAHRGTAGP